MNCWLSQLYHFIRNTKIIATVKICDNWPLNLNQKLTFLGTQHIHNSLSVCWYITKIHHKDFANQSHNDTKKTAIYTKLTTFTSFPS